jgi:hypothetical protein
MMKRRTILAAAAAAAAGAGAPTAGAAALGLFELRSYQTRPGKRDALIGMFEAHFLDAYQQSGATILGTFRNLDDPDRWVWIRAFADHAGRAAALERFYGGEVWRARSAACNATILDVSDALLLQTQSRAWATVAAPGHGAPEPASLIECVRYLPRSEEDDALLSDTLAEMAAVQSRHGGAPIAHLTSAVLAKIDPRRPVRIDPAIVVLTGFVDASAHDACARSLATCADWARLEARCSKRLNAPIERWRLQPTSRSALR